MADKGRRSSTAEEQDASFDALLRQLAHVSGAAACAPAQFSVGTTLSGGRFQILRRIGEGGMGLVYEARDEQRRDCVALKTLARLDAPNIYRLKNEFRSLADVSHRNLVRLHELFGESGESEHWFFTMELVNGKRFDDWVRPAANLDETRLRAALPQLCEGIAAIHAAGKLHRDLKPSNVLMTRDGRVVVLDFGLAVDPELGGIGHTLRDESVSGTPAYMAPEQAAGRPATAASDFYALGVMLFEALTGQLPFLGRTHDMLVDKQRGAAPSVGTSSSARQAALLPPADLAALCDALLARDPGARPNLEEIRTALGAQRLIGVSAAPPAHGRAQHERDVLLGRERELAELSGAYEATRMGKAIVMFVSGESGIGKSALCQAFLDELRTQGHAVVLAGRCHERESVPFKGMDSLVDDLSRFLHKLPHADASALMPREVFALARIFPALGRIDAVAQAPTKDIVDPQELRLRAFAAFCELLARIRDRRPLVLHIDDAQWLDRDAVTFLGYVLAQHEPAAALLLLSHRSEGAEGPTLLSHLGEQLRQNARFERRELALDRLPPDAARELATRLLGAQHAALAGDVAAESSGSPFFVGELSRQALRSSVGAPLTLREAVLAHVQGLSEEVRTLLEVLAVAGGPLAAQLALDAAGATHEQLDVLHAERLVRRSGTGKEFKLECYHDKIRESVVHVLSTERLRALHTSVFAALLRRANAEVEQLALHAQGAGKLDEAARYAAKAALRASESMAFDRAALLWARALELGTHSEVERRDLQTELADALANAGRGADAAHAYLDAGRDAAADEALELKRRAAEQLLISGCIDEGKALLDDVLRSLGLRLPRNTKEALLALGWERLRLKLRPQGLTLRMRQDELPAAQRRELDVLWTAARGLLTVDMFAGVALSNRYARLALDSGVPEHAAQALGCEAWIACATGGVTANARADALCARAEALALASGRPETIAWVQMSRGSVALGLGDHQLCLDLCAQAIETFRERCTGVAFELAVTQAFAHNAANFVGTFAPTADITSMIDEATRRGDALAVVRLIGSSAVARLVRGDVDGVRHDIERTRLHWSQQRGYAWPHVHMLLAESFHAAYLGEHNRALTRLQADWARLEQGYFLRVPVLAMVLRAFRVSWALRVAREHGADGSALRALARSDARALARFREPTTLALAELVKAGLAQDQGQSKDTVRCVRSALTQLEHAGALAFAAGVRRRLGQLLGASEGAELVAQAESTLHAVGAVDLEAATRVLAFGFDVA